MKTKKSIQQAAKQLGLDSQKVKLKKEQLNPINSILNREDTMVIYPTGFGKSAIMQVPALVKQDSLTLVFEPTVSLMYDQVQKLKSLGVKAEYIAKRNEKDHDKILKAVKDGAVTILYAAPERLKSKRFVSALEHNPPWLLVIDEAHCFIEWGKSFRPDYLKIPKLIDVFPERPTILAMTASAPEAYQEEIISRLGITPNIFTVSLERKNLTLVRRTLKTDADKSRRKYLKTVINGYRNQGRIVVYCATKRDTDLVYNYLSKQYPGEVVECHAFMEEKKRENNELKFIQNKKRIR